MTQSPAREFPGDKVESGETPAEALRREIAEDLGCAISVGAHKATCERETVSGTVILDTYRCTLAAGEPRATEDDEIRWLAPRDLAGLQWSPADLPTVQRLWQSRRPVGGRPREDAAATDRHGVGGVTGGGSVFRRRSQRGR